MSHVRVNLLYRLSRMINRAMMKAAPLSRKIRKLLLELSREEESGREERSFIKGVLNLPWEWEGLEYAIVNSLRGTARGVSRFQKSIEKSFALASLLAGVLTVVSLMVLVIIYAP